MHIESLDMVEMKILRKTKTQLDIDYWLTRDDDETQELVIDGRFSIKDKTILSFFTSLPVSKSIWIFNLSVQDDITEADLDCNPNWVLFKGLERVWEYFKNEIIG